MPVEIDISAADVQSIILPASAGPNQLISGPAQLAGWSIRETTGAASAAVHITTGGNLVAAIGVGAGLSDSHYIGSDGIACPQGISVTVVSGTIEGVVYRSWTP